MSSARRRFAYLLVALCTLTVGTALAAPAPEPSELGRRQFDCKKGELQLAGDAGNVRYAPGSYQTIGVPTALGLLRYTCRHIRGVVTCPLDTTSVTVKRGVFPGRFEVRCYGVPSRALLHGDDLPAAPAAGEPATAE